MTQEILDCLLIKAQLLEYKASELLEIIQTEEDIEKYFATLLKVFQKDDFMLIDNSLLAKAREIVQERRFVYMKNPNICRYANELLSLLNTYQSMSLKETIPLKREWLVSEIMNHDLPVALYGISEVLECIKYDYYYMACLVENETNIEIHSSKVVATVSWLLNTYPEFFTEDIERLTFAKTMVEFCSTKGALGTKQSRKIAKRVLEKLNNLQETPEKYEVIVKQKIKK